MLPEEKLSIGHNLDSAGKTPWRVARIGLSCVCVCGGVIVIIKLIDVGRASIIPEGGGPELYESETLTSAQTGPWAGVHSFLSASDLWIWCI